MCYLALPVCFGPEFWLISMANKNNVTMKYLKIGFLEQKSEILKGSGQRIRVGNRKGRKSKGRRKRTVIYYRVGTECPGFSILQLLQVGL